LEIKERIANGISVNIKPPMSSVTRREATTLFSSNKTKKIETKITAAMINPWERAVFENC